MEKSNERALGFAARIGAAIVAPALAVRQADTVGSDRVSKSPADAAVLVVLAYLVLRTRDVVSAIWLVIDGDIGIGLQKLAGGLVKMATAPLVFVVVGGALLTFLAGKRRSLAADFDIACVALVPIIVMEVGLTFALWVSGMTTPLWLTETLLVLTYTWGALIVGVAVFHTRRRPL